MEHLNKYNHFYEEVEHIKEKDLFRKLKNIGLKQEQKIEIDGKYYLNLSSNDYLGLGSDVQILEEFFEFLKNKNPMSYMLTSSSSRLLTGNSPAYEELETKLANLYNRENCLLFNSGYHANTGLIPALTSNKDAIFSDKLNHASIIDGLKLSRAEFYRYNHNDYSHLENILQKNRDKYENAVIISESVFSMDGDVADIPKLIELKDKYNAILYIDEAHAIGVYGKKGLGISEEKNLIDNIDIIVGTFGKAYASIGAYAILNNILKDYLINTARTLIFTTAMPPLNLTWTSFIVDKINVLSEKRRHLINISNDLRKFINNSGLKTLGSTHIIPIMIGNNNDTVRLAKEFQERHILLMAIRPPTVPQGTSRLRISLTSNIGEKDIDYVKNSINKIFKIN